MWLSMSAEELNLLTVLILLFLRLLNYVICVSIRSYMHLVQHSKGSEK